MKPCALRPQAREDRRNEVRYYRNATGPKVAAKLVTALARALRDVERQPGMGSPTLGHELELAGMRTCRFDALPLTFWYLERETHLDVVRLVGQRQDALAIDISEGQDPA